MTMVTTNNISAESLLSKLQYWYNKMLDTSIQFFWEGIDRKLFVDIKNVDQAGHLELRISIHETVAGSKIVEYSTIMEYIENIELPTMIIPYIQRLIFRLIKYTKDNVGRTLEDEDIIEKDSRQLCNVHRTLGLEWLMCDLCTRPPTWYKKEYVQF